MNITTENIEEWCFRYLEKDLDEYERHFFEKELKHNAVLKKELASWKKTILKSPLPSDGGFNYKKSLFRYKGQFLFLLAEFTIVSATLLTLVFFAHTRKISSKKPVAPFIKVTAVPSYTTVEERAISKNNSCKKTFVLIDSSSHTINQGHNQEINMLHEVSQPKDTVSSQDSKNESLNTTDTSSSTQKTFVKKSKKQNPRIKRNGSHLVPINNDL